MVSPPPSRLFPDLRLKRRAQFFVQGEEALHALVLGGEAGAAVEALHGAEMALGVSV